MTVSQFMSLNEAAAGLHDVVCARLTPGGEIVVRFTPFKQLDHGIAGFSVW